MCRWLAYSGPEVFLDTLVTQPAHSLVVQSLKSRLNISASGELLSTNGDGFGIGWYSDRKTPGVFKDDKPAWHDENLMNLCHQVKSHIFFAHIRASTIGEIQRSNCHPFQYDKWLFQHNGHLSHFQQLRRELQLQIAPELYPALKGTTDSETFFLLAISFGLMNSPKAALQKMVLCVLAALKRFAPSGILNLSCALSDGNRLYILRFSYNEQAMTQFYSTDARCLRDFNGGSDNIPGNSIVVVSEPLDRSSDKWTEIPNNTFATIKKQSVSIETFLSQDELGFSISP